MRNRSNIFILFLLFVSISTMATEHGRRQCSRGRHPYHAEVQASLSNATLRRVGDASRRTGLYIGEKRQLVFVVDFSDLYFQDEDPLTLWNKIFNQENYQEAPFRGSIHDYFRDQSFGQFNLQFDLYYVHMDKEHAEYRSGDINFEDDTRSGLLLTEILDQHKEEIPDWSVYDWNEDGSIDQVLILYAGKGQNDGGDDTTIWPHQWWLSDQSKEPYYREWGHQYVIISGDKEYIVDQYGIFPELTRSGTYGTFGTLCHEYGHCLGLPDFYYSNTEVIDMWDIMDSGNYNEGGFCPPGYSAHERMYLGWLDVSELTEPKTITNMGSLSEGQKEAYLIRNDGYDNEYYIVENRQQTGWDSSLPSSGIVIFHVDYDETIWKKGIPNSIDYKHYSIIPANNQTAIRYESYWAYPYEENNALTNESFPASTLFHENVDATFFMSKPLTNMSVAEGLASFDFMGGSTGIFDKKVWGQPKILYDFGPIYIIRNANGETKKVMKH